MKGKLEEVHGACMELFVRVYGILASGGEMPVLSVTRSTGLRVIMRM